MAIKCRKMLGSADSPYIVSLMRAIETQSNETLAKWSADYAQEHFLPIWIKTFPDDDCPRATLDAVCAYMADEIKLPELKTIVKECRLSAKEVKDAPAALAALQAIATAAGTIYCPTNALGFTFYGAAALAYDAVGIEESGETYDAIAATECAKMEAALRAVSVENEPNPAKIKWNC
jgi:hypothetical protein